MGTFLVRSYSVESVTRFLADFGGNRVVRIVNQTRKFFGQSFGALLNILSKSTPPLVRQSLAYCPTALLRMLAIAYLSVSEVLPPDPELVALTPLVGPGSTIVEVGSNIGSGTLVLAKLVGSKGLVIAFEPNPIAFAVLKENLRCYTNVRVYGRGVGLTVGEATLSMASGFADKSATLVGTRRKGSIAVRVNVVTLDEVVSNLGREVDLFVIDAEGAEFQIILGGANVIRHSQKARVVIEFHPLLAPKSVEKTRELLSRWGFNKSWVLAESPSTSTRIFIKN